MTETEHNPGTKDFVKWQLKEILAATGMATTAELMERIGQNANAFTNWPARGRIGTDARERIAEEFGISRDWMATGKGNLWAMDNVPADLNRLTMDERQLIHRIRENPTRPILDMLLECAGLDNSTANAIRHLAKKINHNGEGP